MSYDSLLLDDLQLWRDVETGRDDFNQPEYELQLVDVVRGRVFAQGTLEQRFTPEGTRSTIKAYRITLEHREDVDESSTIVDDASGVYDVLEVNRARDAAGPHHLELLVEKVSAPPDVS